MPFIHFPMPLSCYLQSVKQKYPTNKNRAIIIRPIKRLFTMTISSMPTAIKKATRPMIFFTFITPLPVCRPAEAVRSGSSSLFILCSLACPIARRTIFIPFICLTSVCLWQRTPLLSVLTASGSVHCFRQSLPLLAVFTTSVSPYRFWQYSPLPSVLTASGSVHHFRQSSSEDV